MASIYGYYNRRKEKHLCVVCRTKLPPEDSRVVCEKCRNKRKKKKLKR